MAIPYDSITYDRLGSLFQCVFDAVHGSDDTLGAGNFAIFDWNIEINAVNEEIVKSIKFKITFASFQFSPHQDSLSSQVQAFDA
jgi:hypothetical protein